MRRRSINADGPYADVFLQGVRRRGLRLLTTGSAGETLRLVEARAEGFAQALDRRGVRANRSAPTLPLLGAFQVENALVAAGLVLAVEGEGRAAEVLEGFASLKGVPGRLEQVGEVDGALCIVDYAHKPDALAHVLDALRPFATGRLVCVVRLRRRPGSRQAAAHGPHRRRQGRRGDRHGRQSSLRGPGRDPGRDPAGAPGAREIGDRARGHPHGRQRSFGAGDVLVVAGKGHETGQIIGDRTLPFSDHDEVRAAIAERQG